MSRYTDQPTAALWRTLRVPILGLLTFSGIVNILALTGSVFMLQVYDRVLASRSVPTLVALGLIVTGLYIIQGLLEIVRSRMLVRIGSYTDEVLAEPAFRAVTELPPRVGRAGDGLQPMRDVEAVRGFIAGNGPIALFDLPWIPVYLCFVFLLHPALGLLAASGALVLIVLALIAEVCSHGPAFAARRAADTRTHLAATSASQSEVLKVMGFAHWYGRRWQEAGNEHRAAEGRAGDIVGALGGLARVLRLALQSAILAAGAYLTIKGDMTGGAIIASSIASARALAPVDQAISQWRPFVAARQAWSRLGLVVKALPAHSAVLALPPPSRDLQVRIEAAGAPGQAGVLIRRVAFRLSAGDGLGIIGPSGAGKSSLIKAIIGAWPLTAGEVRIDGASLDQWSPGDLGRHIGYLPQGAGLLEGTIAENISRFDPQANDEAILKAARAADVHDLILQLPEGYATRLGDGGQSLSAGQSQRLALARALYKDPFLIVLDEPNANLDAEGDAALGRAIRGVRARGGIVIVVAHRPSALMAVDLIAVMKNGTLKSFGAKDQLMREGALAQSPSSHNPGLAAVAEPAR